MTNKQGKITPNRVVLKEHEYRTILLLTNLGYDIELIPKSNQQGVHTPDIVMCGERWEMKAPKGRGEYLTANTLQKAVKQSRYIIVDFRRTKRHQNKCLHELKREFTLSKSIKSLKIITKNRQVVDYQK